MAAYLLLVKTGNASWLVLAYQAQLVDALQKSCSDLPVHFDGDASDLTGESIISGELRVHDIGPDGTEGNEGNEEFEDSVDSSAVVSD